MPLTNVSIPNGIRGYGLPLLGPGLGLFSGNVLWVDSQTGKNGNEGTYESPLATLAYALSSVTAPRLNSGKDDVIFIKAGHTESITAAGTITLSKSNVNIIGLGNDGTKPVFTFSTAVGATFLISGNSNRIYNCQFTYTGIDAITTGLSITGTFNDIVGCHFNMSNGTNQAVVAITLGGACTGSRIMDNTFYAMDAGADAAIKSAAAVTRVKIMRNEFVGDFAVAAINGITAAWVNCLICDNIYYGTNASEPIIELLTGSTGIAARNLSGAPFFSAGGSIVADAFYKFENYITDTAANSGILDPIGVTL